MIITSIYYAASLAKWFSFSHISFKLSPVVSCLSWDTAPMRVRF